jgi:hypothetical protein
VPATSTTTALPIKGAVARLEAFWFDDQVDEARAGDESDGDGRAANVARFEAAPVNSQTIGRVVNPPPRV